MNRILALIAIAACALALALPGHPARAGSQTISPNLSNCVPLPSQAWIPGAIDGSAWQILTSGTASGGIGTPGLLCIGLDARPYVFACRLGSSGGCSSPPTFVAVGGAWPTAWP